MVPVRELPYGPAASDAASEAGQMAASDYVPNLQMTPCIFRGVHRWLAHPHERHAWEFLLKWHDDPDPALNVPKMRPDGRIA